MLINQFHHNPTLSALPHVGECIKAMGLPSYSRTGNGGLFLQWGAWSQTYFALILTYEGQWPAATVTCGWDNNRHYLYAKFDGSIVRKYLERESDIPRINEEECLRDISGFVKVRNVA